jgi:hypothetical protein
MAWVHQRLSVVVVLLVLLGTMWAGYSAYRGRAAGRMLWYAGLAITALVLQGVLGAALALTGSRPADGTHFVFGPLALLSLPVALLLRRGRTQRAGALVLFAGYLVTLALSLRALGTGGLTA